MSVSALSATSSPTPAHVRDLLTRAGLRATQQRVLILGGLLALRDHPTAEQVHRQVAAEAPTLSLGTVYKALDSFVVAGLVKRVAVADGAARRYDADCSPHHHLFCTATQEILDYRDPQLDQLIQEFLAARGFENFQPHSFSLHITGEKIIRPA
ncbi:transcriptional repressor [Hymenobacter aerilatus]|uniref:Transcriptional repressor n=1 Tax=Hymenobacter aerilatus TaxID=2932251 RepID=A0A8T9SYF1_9BACT|nr:Fur family transcriptional regulator [Hymenobacter aerilatus]UOR07272.1 transcriptional repressor [Hymenobacter aerilatus]